MVNAVRRGVTMREVARRFGVTLRTVQRWVRRATSARARCAASGSAVARPTRSRSSPSSPTATRGPISNPTPGDCHLPPAPENTDARILNRPGIVGGSNS